MSFALIFAAYAHLFMLAVLLENNVRIAGIKLLAANGEVTLHRSRPEVDESEVDFLPRLRLDEPRARDRSDRAGCHANARKVSRGLCDWLIIFIPGAVHVRSGH